MKVKKKIILLMLLASLASGQNLLYEGGVYGTDENQNCLLYRDIFYPYYQVTPVYCPSIYLNITYPDNGSTYYFPNISPNITFNLSGSDTPTCYYKTLGLWNLINCSNGINGEIVTLPEAYPLPVTVRVDDICGSSYDTIYLNVYYHVPHTAKFSTTYMFLFLLIALMLLALGVKKRRRRLYYAI